MVSDEGSITNAHRPRLMIIAAKAAAKVASLRDFDICISIIPRN